MSSVSNLNQVLGDRYIKNDLEAIEEKTQAGKITLCLASLENFVMSPSWLRAATTSSIAVANIRVGNTHMKFGNAELIIVMTPSFLSKNYSNILFLSRIYCPNRSSSGFCVTENLPMITTTSSIKEYMKKE